MAPSLSLGYIQQLLLLLLLLVMAHLQTSSSNDLVTEICVHNDDPAYCTQLFNADARTPGADLAHLGVIGIDIGLVVATNVSNLIIWKKAAAAGNDKLVKDFNICLVRYDSAKDYLVSASDALSRRDFGSMNTDAHLAQQGGLFCEAAFMATTPPIQAPITADNKHFDEITHAIVVISNMLTRPLGV